MQPIVFRKNFLATIWIDRLERLPGAA
jgi:hypothetical protein